MSGLIKLHTPIIILSVLYLANCSPAGEKQETMHKVPPFEWEVLSTRVEASLRGLSTVDDKTAWASGSEGTVIRTVDGGRRWVKKPVPEAQDLDFRDICAFDENTALVISAGLPAKIFKTTDGGESWVETYYNGNEGVFFDAMDFWNTQNGLAFSDPVEGHLLIITTDDGGETWQQVPKEKIPAAKDGEGGFAASGTCLTVYGDSNAWIGTGVNAARVFRSTDRGQSWQVAETPIIQSRSSTGIFSLAFKNALQGIAVGGDYQLDSLSQANAAITNDGGKTWALIEENPPNGYKSCVSFFGTPDTGQLIALGTSGSDYSLDSGNSWHYMDTAAFHVVSFSKDGKAGFAAGPNGKVAKFKALGISGQGHHQKP